MIAVPGRPVARQILSLMLLTGASGGAIADWIKVAELETGSIYADPDSIRRDGDLVKMGTLYDLKVPISSKTNGKRYVSQKLQGEYDCREEQWRILYFSWHSRNMGGGEMVEYLADAYKWEPVPAGSGVEILRHFACGKK